MEEKEKFLHYIAGFFDGEGCFTVGVGLSRRKGRKFLNIIPRCTISQRIDRRLALDKIYDFFGFGGITNPRADGVVVWETTNQENCLTFIKTIKPLLLLKRKQADMLLEVISLLSQATKEWRESDKIERSLTREQFSEILKIVVEINRNPLNGKKLGRSFEDMMGFVDEVLF